MKLSSRNTQFLANLVIALTMLALTTFAAAAKPASASTIQPPTNHTYTNHRSATNSLISIRDTASVKEDNSALRSKHFHMPAPTSTRSPPRPDTDQQSGEPE